MVNATLDDTAAMAMSAGWNHVFANDIKNELVVLLLEIVQALLEYMVSVDVLRKCNNGPTERLCNSTNLYHNQQSTFRPRQTLGKLTCSGLCVYSSIFWRARVPWELVAIETISGAALLIRTARCSGEQCSSSFWHR
jgi:hypothetical protein